MMRFVEDGQDGQKSGVARQRALCIEYRGGRRDGAQANGYLQHRRRPPDFQAQSRGKTALRIRDCPAMAIGRRPYYLCSSGQAGRPCVTTGLPS